MPDPTRAMYESDERYARRLKRWRVQKVADERGLGELVTLLFEEKPISLIEMAKVTLIAIGAVLFTAAALVVFLFAFAAAILAATCWLWGPIVLIVWLVR